MHIERYIGSVLRLSENKSFYYRIILDMQPIYKIKRNNNRLKKY